ncbi:MAG: Fur family transcriptional regulator [Candidatus Thermoplasmatota archaeon]
MDKYVKILKNKNLKITPQRLEVLRYLDENRIHPSAEKIYQSLKKQNPSLSKTTVYNSLEKLQKKDIITKLTIHPSEHRYDYKNEMHHHFYCKKCGKIYDLDIKCPHIEKIEEKGYTITEVHGYYKGICKKCNQNKEEKK